MPADVWWIDVCDYNQLLLFSHTLTNILYHWDKKIIFRFYKNQGKVLKVSFHFVQVSREWNMKRENLTPKSTYWPSLDVIIRLMNLHLYMPSVPITTNIVDLLSTCTQGKVHSKQLYVAKKLLVTCGRLVFFSGYSGFLSQ